jgi:hypothetical protein
MGLKYSYGSQSNPAEQAEETLEYVADMTTQLARMACDQRLALLGWLLNMAANQARRDLSRARRKLH